MNEIFFNAEYNEIPTRGSYQKLELPRRKTNQDLNAFKNNIKGAFHPKSTKNKNQFYTPPIRFF